MLAVVALWVAGGNVQDLTGWGTGLTAVGRLTGLVASDLLLVQVLLMARIPMVERAYGQDELARRHRLVGFWSVNLMVAHIVVVTVGYAVQARTNVLAEAWDLVVDYPGILLAVAGAGLLLMVAVTSIRKARRRLRYESWHLLHLYAYLGVGLALPHQLWSGQEFMSSTVASLYWWTLWGAAAGAVLVWRVGLPLHRTLTHRIRVVDVVRESDDVVSVVMTGRRLDRLHAAAGQFLALAVPRRARLDPGAPLLALGRSDRGHPPHHGQGPRRRQPRTGARPRRGPASPSRAPTAGCTPASGPVARCCCSPAGSGSPRCAGCSRRCRRSRAT